MKGLVDDAMPIWAFLNIVRSNRLETNRFTVFVFFKQVTISSTAVILLALFQVLFLASCPLSPFFLLTIDVGSRKLLLAFLYCTERFLI